MPTQRATRTRTLPPASDRSISLMRKLLTEREVPDPNRTVLTNALAAHDRVLAGNPTPLDTVATQRMVSTAIDYLDPLPVKPREGGATEGFYELDGRVYRVKRAQRGHLYALVLTGPNGESEVAAWNDPTDTDWTMAPGVYRKLGAAHRMSVERAEELSRLIARCIRCNAELSAPDSRARGIGPICRKKF